MITEADLVRAANDTGFQVEPLSKVERLLALLDGLRSHTFLKGRVALKGGTALNLFVFDVPRLSVDIDLNYSIQAQGPCPGGRRRACQPALLLLLGLARDSSGDVRPALQRPPHVLCRPFARRHVRPEGSGLLRRVSQPYVSFLGTRYP